VSTKRKPTGVPKPAGPPIGQLRLDDTLGLNAEAWLANRLTEWHGVPDAFSGATDPATRKARIRQAITSHGLEWVICGRDTTSRECVTWGKAFERVYGEKP
jgi:hypothetical protein